MFGDKDAELGVIVDPGAPVAQTTSQEIIDAGLAALADPTTTNFQFATQNPLVDVPTVVEVVTEKIVEKPPVEDFKPKGGTGPGVDAAGLDDGPGADQPGNAGTGLLRSLPAHLRNRHRAGAGEAADP